MMEFVASRATLVVCGVLLIAAVAAPLEDLYGTREDSAMGEVADSIASAVDTFSSSQLDTLRIRGSDILPSASAFVTMEGHFVTLYTPGRDYVRAVACTCDAMSLGYGDEITLEKDGNRVSCHRTSPISS